MANAATIQVRIDAKKKREAAKVLDELGLDFSSAVKLFVNQLVHDQALPFRPNAQKPFLGYPNKEAYKKDVEWALKHGKRYDTAEEAIRALWGDDE
jgi:DNA-damage-inducible protein J